MEPASPLFGRPEETSPAQASDPAAMLQRIEAHLQRLDARLERLERVERLFEQVPGLLAVAGDTFDDVADAAERRGVEIGALLPRLLDLLVQGAHALQRAQDRPQTVRGMVSLWRALREPQVQRSLGFMLEILRSLGADLESGQRLALSPSPARP